jgi:hypothetical protein
MAEDRKAQQDDILDSVVRVPEHVVHRSFEAETLLLNLETGQYHGLNETGGRMLELLEATDGRVRDAIERLAEEYEVAFSEIAPDLTSFCSDLETRGLIVVARGET